MQIKFGQVQAFYTVEWLLPLLPLPNQGFRDSRKELYEVRGRDKDGVVLYGPSFPVGWLEPIEENWAMRTFEIRLCDMWAQVECFDFATDGATIPNEFVPEGVGLSGNLVFHQKPVSFLPLESIGSVHVLFTPDKGIHGDFSGANLRGKEFDRLDLTVDPAKGRISAVEHEIEIDTKAVKTKVWVGDFRRACGEAIQMARSLLADAPLIIEHRLGLGPSGDDD